MSSPKTDLELSNVVSEWNIPNQICWGLCILCSMTLIKCYCRVQHFSTKIWMDTWMHSAETKFGRVHPDCHVALCCATVTPLWVAKHILNCIMIQILNMCCPRICFTTLRLCSDRSLKLPTLKLWMHTSSACHVYIIDLCMRKNTWKEKFIN